MHKGLLLILTWASLGIVNCTQLSSSTPKLQTEGENIMEIQQTTVANIDGIRVAVGNIFLEDKYTLADGQHPSRTYGDGCYLGKLAHCR